MARTNPIKTCPCCEKPLTGCACGHRKAKDGSMVHRNCLAKYNYILEKKEKNEEKK